MFAGPKESEATPQLVSSPNRPDCHRRIGQQAQQEEGGHDD